MILWQKYLNSFQINASRTAFCIENRTYTYSDFTALVSGSQQLLIKALKGESGLPIGVVCHDSIETFAAIFAIWFSGCHFVPLHPYHPIAVNNEKIQDAKISIVFSSKTTTEYDSTKAQLITNKGNTSRNPLHIFPEQNLAYILFTSGSTRKPKGVPISVQNLHAFINGFLDIYPDLSSDDRFLQTYDLTSDAAFTGYLVPLFLGATVFTISPTAIKYLAIVKQLGEYQITWTQFTPSVMNYLRPYMKSLRFEKLKHSHFGGESLPLNLVKEWSNCVPNAEISNIYGPTETTITCTIYRSTLNQLCLHTHNGQVSIGKPLKEVKILIVDENSKVLPDGQKGELCIGGPQVMEHYLQSDSISHFLIIEDERYYRSGDLVFRDKDGFLMFCGRKDEQLKINGYRIEPAEIERAISLATNGLKSRVFGFKKKDGMDTMVAFVEKYERQPDELKETLRSLLSPAFIPEKIIAISQFPLNTNGKIDKSKLFQDYSTQLI